MKIKIQELKTEELESLKLLAIEEQKRRKSKDMTTLIFLLPIELRDWFRDYAGGKGRHMSEFLRDYIYYLRKRDET